MEIRRFYRREASLRKALGLAALAPVLALGLAFADPARARDGADPFARGASLIAADQAAASGGREAWAADMPAMEIRWLDLHGAHLMSYGSSMGGDGVFDLSLGRTGQDGSFESFQVFIDGQGTILFCSDYDRFESIGFSDGFIIAGRFIEDDRVWKPGEIRAPPGSRNTYVDKTGRELIPPGSYDGMSDFHEGMAAVAVSTNADAPSGEVLLWGYLDATGALAIPPQFKEASAFREGLAPVRDAAGGKWGFVDRTGQPVIPYAYDFAMPFSEGLAYVQQNGRAGYIDKENRVVIPIELAADPVLPGSTRLAVDPSFYKGRAVARANAEFRHYSAWDGSELTEDHLYGYIDTSGAFVVEPNLYSAQPFSQNLALVSYANAAFTSLPSALIDRDGNRVTPFWSYSHYDIPVYSGADLYIVRNFGVSDFAPLNERGMGVLNGNGAEVVPLRFYIISEFNEEGAAVAIMQDEQDADPRVALLRATPESALPQAGRLIKIEIDGERLTLPDSDPVIENGRTLVPLRYIFEALGAELTWNEADKTVTGRKDGAEIRLKIGDSAAQVNGERVALDAPPVLRGGRTLVPVRFIAESLGAQVDWDPARRAVVIAAPKVPDRDDADGKAVLE